MPLATPAELYSGALLPDVVADTLRNTDRLFPTRVVRAATRPSSLAVGRPMDNVTFRANGAEYDLFDYLALNRVAGLLVLHDERIRFETYQLGNRAETRWASMSMAKSVTATLVGVALHEGLIGSLDDAVVTYLPALRSTAYESVTLRQVSQMTSGLGWNEEYTDPLSDRRRLLALQMRGEPGMVLDFIRSLPRAAVPGTRWNYSTADTHVLGLALRAAIGGPLADYLSDRIWRPCGMQADAAWWLESADGVEIGGSGLTATLRDYARFGLFLANDGRIDGKAHLPAGWITEATRPQRLGGETVPYGYMLWPIADDVDGRDFSGVFEARGIFGQHIYVNPQMRVVVVVNAAQPKPRFKAAIPDHLFCAAVTKAVAMH